MGWSEADHAQLQSKYIGRSDFPISDNRGGRAAVVIYPQRSSDPREGAVLRMRSPQLVPGRPLIEHY